jgi:hypothetical protein
VLLVMTLVVMTPAVSFADDSKDCLKGGQSLSLELNEGLPLSLEEGSRVVAL